MLKTVDWNKELEKLNENFSDEGAIKIYDAKLAEASQTDLHRDTPTLVKRIAKTCFYVLGAAAGIAAACLTKDTSVLVQIPATLAALGASGAMGMSALQSGYLLYDYADNLKTWGKQQTEKMANMTEEEKNAYKIAYVKSDMEYKANNKVLGINGFNYDLQNLAKNGVLAGTCAAIPVAAIAAGIVAPVAIPGYLGYEAIKNRISDIRNSGKDDDNTSTPKNTI